MLVIFIFLFFDPATHVSRLFKIKVTTATCTMYIALANHLRSLHFFFWFFFIYLCCLNKSSDSIFAMYFCAVIIIQVYYFTIILCDDQLDDPAQHHPLFLPPWTTTENIHSKERRNKIREQRRRRQTQVLIQQQPIHLFSYNLNLFQKSTRIKTSAPTSLEIWQTSGLWCFHSLICRIKIVLKCGATVVCFIKWKIY